jgi:hypothetical protein
MGAVTAAIDQTGADTGARKHCTLTQDQLENMSSQGA